VKSTTNLTSNIVVTHTDVPEVLKRTCGAQNDEVEAEVEESEGEEVVGVVGEVVGEEEEGEEEWLCPEELAERRLNEVKCRQWLDGLPDKFSGMHIVQQTLYTAHR
jgi:hypothetical protein